MDKENCIIFKIPYNYDFEYFRKYILDKVTIFPYKKDSRIKYFLLVIEKDTAL